MGVQEHNPEPSNPLGMDGIEFIEYATSQPQALGALLQTFGFMPVARHRSREVMLYRQGPMNVIVNAHADVLPGLTAPVATPAITAIAFRVRDADYAWRRALDLGAWEMPTRASAMELNIPGIHGVGDSLLYFVDRYRDFSIYDVDFVPLPGMDPHPPAIARMHYFGVVQAIQDDRSDDWIDFYTQLFGFSVLPGGQYFGIMPKGTLLESPVSQVLSAAHRAAARRRRYRVGRAAAARRARRARCARGGRSAARAWRRLRRSRSHPAERQGCADPDLPRRRHVRARGEPPRVRCNRKGPGGAMNIDQFGMDTTTLAGPLEAKLAAVRAAGFTQIMLQARDIAGHPDGEAAAIEAVRRSGLRVTGFQALRDFEGLTGHLHAYKVDIARAMLSMCDALGTKVLVVCSSTSTHATTTPRRTCAISPSSPCWRCPSVSGSLTARCRGDVTSTIFRRRGTSSCARTVPTSASPSIRITCSRPHAARRARRRRSGQDPVRAACGFHVARAPLDRRADEYRTALPRVSRRRRAQRAYRGARPAPGRDRLPRRLQLRCLQRRLRAAPARDGRGARAAIRAFPGRTSVAAQPSGAPRFPPSDPLVATRRAGRARAVSPREPCGIWRRPPR